MCNTLKNIKTWIQFVLIAVLLPLFILISSIQYVNKLKYDKAKEEFSMQSTEILTEYKKRYTYKEFIAEKIRNIYDTSKDVRNLKKSMLKFSNQYKIGCKFLIWDGAKKLYFSSFDMGNSTEDWLYAYDILYEIKINKKYKEGDQIPQGINKRLQKLFGPLFISRHIHLSYSQPKLLHNSISEDYPLLWIYVAKNDASLVVICDFDKITRNNVLESTTYQLQKQYPNMSFAIIDEKECLFADEKIIKVVNKNIIDLTNPYNNIIDRNEYLFYSSKIGFRYTAVVIIDKKNLRIQWHQLSKLLLLIILFFAIFIIYKSYQIIVLEAKIYLNVRHKLLLLFVLFGLMPPFLLAVLSYDYLQQYEISERTKVYLNGSRYLRHLDEIYSTELTRQIILLKKAKSKLKKSLKVDGLTSNNLLSFLNIQDPKPFRMVLVGSSTHRFGTDSGILENNKTISKLHNSEKNVSKNIHYTKIMAKLASFLLKTINGIKISQKDTTELEFVADAMGKTSPIDVMHNFFSKMNDFWKIGFGSRRFPGFIDSFKIFDKDMIDYIMFYTWKPSSLSFSFINRKIADFNRNSYGLKIFAQFIREGTIIPKKYANDAFLISYADKLNEKNGTSIIKFQQKNEEYYLMGLKCSHMPNVKLIGIYPQNIINKKIVSQKNLFLMLAIVNFLVSVSFGLFISRVILAPLLIVRNGVEKMKNKEFDFRLPFLGNNEFGDLGEILNETMVDLDELRTAGDFKTKVFGKINETNNFELFSIFASELSLSEFNGNYFDLTIINEKMASVLFGTVYEEGIASGLITAYIKSCSIQLDSLSANIGEYLLKQQQLLSHIQHVDVHAPDLSYLLLNIEQKTVSIDEKSLCNGFLLQGDGCAHNLEEVNVLTHGHVIIIFSSQLLNHLEELNIDVSDMLINSYSENIEQIKLLLKVELKKAIDDAKQYENFLIISMRESLDT